MEQYERDHCYVTVPEASSSFSFLATHDVCSLVQVPYPEVVGNYHKCWTKAKAEVHHSGHLGIDHVSSYHPSPNLEHIVITV